MVEIGGSGLEDAVLGMSPLGSNVLGCCTPCPYRWAGSVLQGLSPFCPLP